MNPATFSLLAALRIFLPAWNRFPILCKQKSFLAALVMLAIGLPAVGRPCPPQ